MFPMTPAESWSFILLTVMTAISFVYWLKVREYERREEVRTNLAWQRIANKSSEVYDIEKEDAREKYVESLIAMGYTRGLANAEFHKLWNALNKKETE